jgi:hypothetical protein
VRHVFSSDCLARRHALPSIPVVDIARCRYALNLNAATARQGVFAELLEMSKAASDDERYVTKPTPSPSFSTTAPPSSSLIIEPYIGRHQASRRKT